MIYSESLLCVINLVFERWSCKASLFLSNKDQTKPSPSNNNDRSAEKNLSVACLQFGFCLDSLMTKICQLRMPNVCPPFTQCQPKYRKLIDNRNALYARLPLSIALPPINGINMEVPTNRTAESNKQS